MIERTVNLPTASLALLESGVGGRPLLLVHGFTGSKEDFGDEVDRLAALGFHVVSPDLRGHGSSQWFADEDAYDLETYLADLIGLVDSLGWERFDLLGHSMGGMIAQGFALRLPERIDRLILMDTHHGVIGTLDHDLLAMGAEVVRNDGLEVLQAILKMGVDPLQSVPFERTCAEREGYREWADGKMLNVDPSMYAAMLVRLGQLDDRLESLAALSMPTLVLVGELDEPFFAASERIAATIPGAVLDVLPLGGHCPQFEATDAWRTSVDRFLVADR